MWQVLPILSRAGRMRFSRRLMPSSVREYFAIYCEAKLQTHFFLKRDLKRGTSEEFVQVEAMNLYALDYSALDIGFIDPTFDEFLSPSHEMIVDRRNREREVQNLLKLSNSLLSKANSSDRSINDPPKQRHDGTSPLPLGMDWSSPPRTWDGPHTTWPHDFRTGWSYCVTIPSWCFLSESEGSEPGVFYRVQVGLQSPEGVTTTREVLRRFSDFLKLSSDLKQSFLKKKMPLPPPKGIFKMKSKTALNERRCSLEVWMTKVLSDIDLSRSAVVACFLELEAVARLSFRESSHDVPESNLSCNSSISSAPASNHPDALPDCASALASIHSTPEASEIVSELHPKDDDSKIGNRIKVFVDGVVSNEALCRNDNATPSAESRETLPMAEKQNQFLSATEQQLVTAETDIEDLVARLNQERAVREYLNMKINDLETELESTKKSAKENLEQAIIMEEERITQMQWEMEELRGKCIEMELRLKPKPKEDENGNDIFRDDGTLEEFESVREQLRNLQKHHEETELKSKSEIKLLVKEVKSLRSSQSELRQEIEKIAEEKMEFERKLQNERAEREHINAANTKLLHECEILRGQLGEFSINFLIDEENKLRRDVLSSPDACDRLAAAENQIGHLLVEAQRLKQDTTIPISSLNNSTLTVDNELRKMLIDVIIENANLRKQANAIVQCGFSMTDTSLDSFHTVKEE